jgi:putative ABC transport system permease protein
MEVSPEYFRVARIPLLRGRGFDANLATAAGEVIINQSLARRLWPDRDALGARMRYGDEVPSRWLTVVGIAADVRMPGDGGPDFFGLQVYRSPGFMDGGDGSLLIRSRSTASQLRPLLARALERAGVAVKLFGVEKASMPLEYAYQTPRFAVAVFGTFTLVAVLLAAVGLFGILAHAVARRTREIGIRIALGADPISLTKSILGRSLQLVVIGCILGVVSTLAAARLLTTIVFGVQPMDSAALGAGMAVLLLIAVTASVVPVRRALRVDPMDALRAE